MTTTPRELLNRSITFDIAEAYYPGCSVAWDIQGGQEWSRRHDDRDLMLGVVCGELCASVTELSSYVSVHGARNPIFHWAFYNNDNQTWTML